MAFVDFRHFLPERLNDLIDALLIGHISERDSHQIQQCKEHRRVVLRASPDGDRMKLRQGRIWRQSVNESLRDLLSKLSSQQVLPYLRYRKVIRGKHGNR